MKTAREKPVIGRREARRIDRRDAILAVAYKSFLEHGYAATTMSAIAAQVGGSKATLWSYFPSKEALFEAVLDQATTAFRAQLLPLLDPQGDPEATLRSYCTRFIEKVVAPEAVALNRLVHAEAGRFPEIGGIFLERGPRTTQRLLGNFLAGAMERGLLRQSDPLRAARALNVLSLSGCHQQLVLGQIESATPEMIAADVENALDIFMRAFAP